MLKMSLEEQTAMTANAKYSKRLFTGGEFHALDGKLAEKSPTAHPLRSRRRMELSRNNDGYKDE